MNEHVHEWERGAHMTEAFGVDGRRFACAICGAPKPTFEVSIVYYDDCRCCGGTGRVPKAPR